MPRFKLLKLFMSEGSKSCFKDRSTLLLPPPPPGEEEEEGGERGVNVVWTFLCAVRNHDSNAPLESSSVCAVSRCYPWGDSYASVVAHCQDTCIVYTLLY